jgi:hypothetical protein
MRVHAIALTTLLLGLAPTAFGQVNPLSTVAGLKAACETSPGNVVRITTDMAVNVNGPGAVSTGCTLELVGDSEIQFDKVSMSFAGPFAITGGTKTGLQLQHAVLSAPSVSIRLTGDEAYVKSEFSRIDATAGDLELQLGRIGKMELMYNVTAGVPLTRATLAATGALRISAGDKLSAAMKEVGLVAGTTLSFTGTGSESELKLDDTGVLSFGGSVSILMLGGKSKFEASNASLTARGGDLDLAMGQAESGLKLSNVTTSSAGRTQVYAAAARSEVGISNGSMVAGSGMFLSAAAGAEFGSLKVENGAFRSGTPMRLVTGASGKTTVIGATLNSDGLLDIATGMGGVCEALGNRVTAVTQQVCR